MSINGGKADVVLRKINAISGAYGKRLASLVSNIKHMAKADIYRVTIDIDANQLGGGECVAQVLDAGDKLNFVPVLVFIDPKEVDEPSEVSPWQWLKTKPETAGRYMWKENDAPHYTAKFCKITDDGNGLKIKFAEEDSTHSLAVVAAREWIKIPDGTRR